MRGLTLLLHFTIGVLLVGLGDTRSVRKEALDLEDNLNNEIKFKNKISFLDFLKHDLDNPYGSKIVFNQDDLSDDYDGEYDNQEEVVLNKEDETLNWVRGDIDSDEYFYERKIDVDDLSIEDNRDDISNDNEEYNNDEDIINRDEVNQSYKKREEDGFGGMYMWKRNDEDNFERRKNKAFAFNEDYSNENSIDNKDEMSQSYQKNDDDIKKDEYTLYENEKDDKENYINYKNRVHQYYLKNDDDSEEGEYDRFKDKKVINEVINREDEVYQPYKNNAADSAEGGLSLFNGDDYDQEQVFDNEGDQIYQDDDDDRFGMMDYIENRKVKDEDNSNDLRLYAQIDTDFANMDYSPEDYVSKYDDYM